MPKLVSAWLCLMVLGIGCGGGDSSAPAVNADASSPSGEGACAILMQGEVDELLESPAGVGVSESLGDGVELCSWPPGDDPWLIVQVGPGVADIREAVNLGEDYPIQDVTGMAGPAAMAVDVIETHDVAVFAVQAGGKTLTVSPIGLGVPPSGPEFERFKSIVALMAGRI